MKFLSITNLRAGDVLLCYKDAKLDLLGKKISAITGSDYTHAAICLDDTSAVESVVSAGVKKLAIQDVVSRYDHVAVFRQPDAWNSSERVEALNTFVNSVIASKAKYNLRGVLAFKKRSEIHHLSLTEQLEAFFEGKIEPEAIEKGTYFCSELVANCFVAVGFLDPSAAIVFKSSTTSPGALGRDSAYGTFYGYLTNSASYVIPDADEFFNAPTFDEVWGNGAA